MNRNSKNEKNPEEIGMSGNTQDDKSPQKQFDVIADTKAKQGPKLRTDTQLVHRMLIVLNLVPVEIQKKQGWKAWEGRTVSFKRE